LILLTIKTDFCILFNGTNKSVPDSEKYKIKEEVKEGLNTNFNILTDTMRILNRRKFVKNSLAAGVASFI
jgi:hypothetical protein